MCDLLQLDVIYTVICSAVDGKCDQTIRYPAIGHVLILSAASDADLKSGGAVGCVLTPSLEVQPECVWTR